MREFKFRAWQKNAPEDLQMWSWREMCEMELDVFFRDYHNKYKLMQFTGLKDKKGNEIYDGDILSIEGRDTPQILYYEGNAFQTDEFLLFEKKLLKTIEVIGNVYENPELKELC